MTTALSTFSLPSSRYCYHVRPGLNEFAVGSPNWECLELLDKNAADSLIPIQLDEAA